jgi:hypothetical protein
MSGVVAVATLGLSIAAHAPNRVVTDPHRFDAASAPVPYASLNRAMPGLGGTAYEARTRQTGTEMTLGTYWIVVAIALSIIGAAVSIVRDRLIDRVDQRRRAGRSDPVPPSAPMDSQSDDEPSQPLATRR